MTEPARPPWWLDGGSESCTACTHSYAYEMEFRCVACDRGLCCHCVRLDVSSRTVLCTDCAAETSEEE
jgi:hypothetical protein